MDKSTIKQPNKAAKNAAVKPKALILPHFPRLCTLKPQRKTAFTIFSGV